MGKKQMPEGLEEMAKDTDGIGRQELEHTYDELLDEVKETDIERRTLLRAFAGGGGLAVLNTLFAQKKYMGDDFESGLQAVAEYTDEGLPMGVRRVDGPTYEVDDEVYTRFGNPSGSIKGQQIDFNHFPTIAKWIEEQGGKPASNKTLIENSLEGAGTLIKKRAHGSNPIKGESPGMVRSHIALDTALGSIMDLVAFPGAAIDQEVQREVATSDSYTTERPPDIDDPQLLSTMVKKTGRLAGSADVGVGRLDRRWIYSSMVYRAMAYEGVPESEIVFDDVDKPIIEEFRMVIPNSMNRVVVGLIEMPLTVNQTSPTPASSGATSLGYGRMGLSSVAIATFIRNMGYNAIPCMNDTGVSPPMAIDAGLGQDSRLRLMHPEFGNNVRIFKVLTDMPLAIDPYIEFGATEFCHGCQLCAHNCPSNSIPMGDRTWKYEGAAPASWKNVTDIPWDAGKNPGVYKWYWEPNRGCQYLMENGVQCSNCVVSCPFTQGRSWLHDIIRSLAGQSSEMDKTLVGMSQQFGYDRFRDPAEVWEMDYLPFGLSQDPGLGDL